MNQTIGFSMPAGSHLPPPRSIFFMILEHFILESLHDPRVAERELLDLEAIKDFADAGYLTITDRQAEKIREAGLFWVRGAIEAPDRAEQYRDVANSMLTLV